MIILNYSGEQQTAVLKVSMEDMDTKERGQGQVKLKGYETKVYKLLKK